MPSIVPTITTENTDFEAAINYSIFLEDKYMWLGQKLAKEIIADNPHLSSSELRKSVEFKMFQFVMSVKNYLDENLKE